MSSMQKTQCGIVGAMQQRRPEVLPACILHVISHLWRYMEHPIRQCEIAMHEVNLVLSTGFTCNRVLLG